MKKGTFSATIDGLAAITATSVLVQYRARDDGDSQGTTLTVGVTPYTFTEEIAVETVAVEVTGFAAKVADFVTLSGDLGFKKSGATIIAVGCGRDGGVGGGSGEREPDGRGVWVAGSEGETAFELKKGRSARRLTGWRR